MSSVMLPVGHDAAHRPQPIHRSVDRRKGLSVIRCFVKKPPSRRLLVFGQRPIVSSSMPFRLSLMNVINRERSAAAFSFLRVSFSGVSTSMNGRPTYDSGMINENALSKCMPFFDKSLLSISMVSPMLSPAVQRVKQ